MGTETEQFSRALYPPYTEGDNCYSPATDSLDPQQYRDWEMRVYSQMQNNATNVTESEYFAAARKVQVNI